MRKDWTETTLSEIAEVNMGQSPPGSSYNSEGIGLPFMQGSAEFGEHNPTPVKWCSSPAKIAEIGDLLLSVRAPVGDTNIANQRIAIGRGLATIRGGKESNTGFLRLLVQKNTAELIANSGTGMFSSITGKNLKEFKILMPPLAEQKRIVDVVSSVDAYIDALQQQSDLARAARNAVLHDLLSAGGDDWTVTTLGDISEVSYGYTESASETEVGPKFLRITDIQNGNVDWSLVPYCPIEKKQFEKQRLKNGDIVFARTGATTGKSFLILNPPPSVCASYLIRLRPNETEVIPYFLNLNFQTDEYWINIKSGMSGSAQGGFNASKLSSLSVSLPPIEEQKRIVEIVSSMDEMIQSTEKAVVDAKALRSGLLSDLLSGNHEIPASYDALLGAA